MYAKVQTRVYNVHWHANVHVLSFQNFLYLRKKQRRQLMITVDICKVHCVLILYAFCVKICIIVDVDRIVLQSHL